MYYNGSMDLAFYMNGMTLATACISVVIYSLLVLLSSYCWFVIMSYIDKDSNMHFTGSNKIYAKANISKYLPGNVFQYLQRQAIGTAYGYTHASLALGSLLETVFVIVTVVALLILFMLFGFQIPDPLVLCIQHKNTALVVLLGIVLVLAAYLIKNRKFAFIKRMLSYGFLALFFKVAANYSVILLLFGILFAGLYMALSGNTVTIIMLGPFMFAFLASWILGFITPGSPAGIGVRESILLILLGTQFGRDQILITALALRVVTICGDLLVFVAAYFDLFPRARSNE